MASDADLARARRWLRRMREPGRRCEDAAHVGADAPVCIEDAVALIRAVRRECAQVADDYRELARHCGATQAKHYCDEVRASILALNAPRSRKGKR